MALPDPIEMPDPLPVNSKMFDLTNPQLITPVGFGFVQTIDRGPQMWVAQYMTPALTDQRDQDFQAFLDDLNGAAFTFLGFDPRRTRPYAYRGVGGTPWNSGGGDARVVSTNFTNSTIDLDQFAVGALITKGDYISWLDGNIWRLFRSAANATADGSGLVTGLKVTPRPPTISGDLTLRLVRACCEMKILAGVQKSDKVEDTGPSYTFTAVQFINRST